MFIESEVHQVPVTKFTLYNLSEDEVRAIRHAVDTVFAEKEPGEFYHDVLEGLSASMADF